MKINATPFSGNGVYTLKKDEKCHYDIAVKNIRALKEKRIIDEINWAIIGYIGKYYMLNHELIYSLLVREFSLGIDRTKLEKRLIRLRELGIINMYQKKEGEQCVYVLSEGAYIYYSLENGEKRKRQKMDAADVIDAYMINHVMPINSLQINAKTIPGAKLECKDVVLQFVRLFTLDIGWININIVARAIRRNENIKNVITELEQRAFNYYKGMVHYLVLLCEDSKHIIEINKQENDIPDNMYFTTDRESICGFLTGLYGRDSKNLSNINSVHFKID